MAIDLVGKSMGKKWGFDRDRNRCSGILMGISGGFQNHRGSPTSLVIIHGISEHQMGKKSVGASTMTFLKPPKHGHLKTSHADGRY